MDKFKQLPFVMQVFITVATMVTVLAVGFWQFPNIKQKNEEIKNQRAKLDGLQSEIQKGINLEKKLPELEREIASLESQLDELKSIMPPTREDSEIVSKLESVAKRSRLAIRQLITQRPRRKDFYDEYPIAIDVSANYHDLAKFFDRVAHLPRIFNISGVALKQYRAGGAGSVAPFSLDASFTTVTFIYREDEPAAPAPAKPPGPPAGK